MLCIYVQDLYIKEPRHQQIEIFFYTSNVSHLLSFVVFCFWLLKMNLQRADILEFELEII